MQTGACGGEWKTGAQPGKLLRKRAAAQRRFHALLREIISSKQGLGVPKGARLTPGGGGHPMQGLGCLVKAPVTPTSIFWHVTVWSGMMLSCGRVNCIYLLPGSGWAQTVLFAMVVC